MAEYQCGTKQSPHAEMKVMKQNKLVSVSGALQELFQSSTERIKHLNVGTGSLVKI